MFAKIFALFALVAVAAAAPSPKAAPEPAPAPQLLYSGLDYAYSAPVYSGYSAYSAPVYPSYSAYSAVPGAYYVR